MPDDVNVKVPVVAALLRSCLLCFFLQNVMMAGKATGHHATCFGLALFTRRNTKTLPMTVPIMAPTSLALTMKTKTHTSLPWCR